jgi:hypothetical protein
VFVTYQARADLTTGTAEAQRQQQAVVRAKEEAIAQAEEANKVRNQDVINTGSHPGLSHTV